MAWIVTAIGGLFTAAGAATTAAVLLPTMTVTAAALPVAAGLTLGGAAAIGAGAVGAYAASGGFDGGGGDGGGEGRYGGSDNGGGGSPLSAQDLYDLGYEFDMPMSEADVANMTQEAGSSLGLESAGFTWKDGLGWIKTGLGIFNSLAGAYGQYRQGRNAAGNADAAARDSRLSAEDAKRRSEQLELWGMGQSKLMQPWDENGGRAMAGEQLKALLDNPSGVAANDPAYKLRMQAAARAMGIYGQDSGAMGVAAADASSSWYDQRLQQLSGLAGATAPPGAGGQLGYQTHTGAANIAGMGQASGAFANQASGAANDARNRSTVTTINAAGQLIDAAGRLIGGGGSSGGDYTFNTVDRSAGGIGGGSGGSGPGSGDGITVGAPGGYAAPATINGKMGFEPGTGISQNTGPAAGTQGPYPLGPAGPGSEFPTWDEAGGPLTPGFNGNPAGPTFPGAVPIGSGGSPFTGPLQQMQDVGRPRYDKSMPVEARTNWRQPDPDAGYRNGAVGVMGQLGSQTGPQAPGPVPNAPVPNAQGNTLGGGMGGGGNDAWQDGLLQQFGYGGGDLLGDYLRPRRLV